MDNRKAELDIFFNRYAERFNQSLDGEVVDAEQTAAAFADCFVEASPVGINCGQNDESFRKVIPQGYQFYKSIGITSMDINAKEITLLDAYHAMVKIKWSSRFIRKDHSQGSIGFEVIYFLQTKDMAPKIFAYITGDEQASLKANGLI